jgi:hypothetical protein
MRQGAFVVQGFTDLGFELRIRGNARLGLDLRISSLSSDANLIKTPLCSGQYNVDQFLKTSVAQPVL